MREARSVLRVVTLWLGIAVVPASADIYQWEWVDPADPSQGRQASNAVCPGGAGVNAEPGTSMLGLDLTQAYLAEANLGGAWLSGAVLAFAELSGAKLDGANLPLANLTGAVLVGASLRDAYCRKTVFVDADLAKADMCNAELYLAVLTGANLSDAIIRGARLNEATSRGFTATQMYSTASYRSGDMRAIYLGGNVLSGWDFGEKDLGGAFFQSSDLTNAVFRGSNLSNANLASTLVNADFTGANLTSAMLIGDLTNATLSDALVAGANLGTAQTKGVSAAQLYSTASYRAKDLRGITINGDLSGWKLGGQNLTNAKLRSTVLTNTDLVGADTRGALDLTDAKLALAVTANMIRPDGALRGLDLGGGRMLQVRDYDGDTTAAANPIAIHVRSGMNTAPDGLLAMVFEADDWGSTISFEPGVPVTLGGTLELAFAPGTDVVTQIGRTFDVFDWTGVTPTGRFSVSSRYEWDLSGLYTTGDITLLTPEPASLAMLVLGSFFFTRRRNQRLR